MGDHPAGDPRDQDATGHTASSPASPSDPARANVPQADGERWFGTQQAARFLNVHRSTVNLAIKRNNLIADYITPGGHHRFKTSTLEAFRETLRTDAATNVARATEPVRLLGTIAQELMATGDLPTICAETIAGIRRAERDIDMVTIIRLGHDPHQSEPAPVRPRIEGLASDGFSEAARQTFLRLRNEHMETISSRALLAGKPIILNDTMEQELPYASSTVLRQAEIRSFAVLPITALGRTYGALSIGSRKPGIFTPSLVAYLDTIVRQLALMLRSDEFLAISRELMSFAVRLRAGAATAERALSAPSAPEARERILASRLGDLTRVFTTYTGAHRTWGYNVPGVPKPRLGEQRLADLGCEVCQKDIVPPNRAVEYTIGGKPHTALATSFEISPAHHGVVGAVWHGSHQANPGDYALLMTYGASCLIATGPDFPSGGDAAHF